MSTEISAQLQQLPRLPKPRITGFVAGAVSRTTSPKIAPRTDDPDPRLQYPRAGLRRPEIRSTRKHLQQLAAEREQKELRGPLPLLPQLKPGTKLLRQWQGQMHEILVVDDGFEYRGKRYKTLSEIARQITGTRWSGPFSSV